MFGYKETRHLLDTSSSSSSEGSDTDSEREDRSHFPDPNLDEPILSDVASADTIDHLLTLLYNRHNPKGTLENITAFLLEELSLHYRVKYLWRESGTMRAVENNIGPASHPTNGSAMAAFYNSARPSLAPIIRKWLRQSVSGFNQ